MFVNEPPPSPERDEAYQADLDDNGYIDNLTRVWAWRPDVLSGFAELRAQLQRSWSLTDLDRAVLVVATARSRSDSYCSLAWGKMLAELVGDAVAAQLIRGELDDLDERAQALANWATAVVKDPNSTTPADVETLRAVGLSEQAIVEVTVFIALRLAFATVNDALGAAPDAQLAATAPPLVRAAVTYGRPPARS